MINKRWLYAASIRAIKTFCQSLLASIGTTAVALHEVNWTYALSVAAVAAIFSVITSFAGLPEFRRLLGQLCMVGRGECRWLYRQSECGVPAQAAFR